MGDTKREPGRGSVPNSAGNAPEREHVLLTVLGTNPRPALYTFPGKDGKEAKKEKAQLAPVALLRLLPPADCPNRILAICTPEAEGDSWPLLKEALGDQYTVELVRVPSGDTGDVVNDYLKRVTAGIRADVDLTLDVTHGFRHYSFLTYVAVLYLAALRGVRVRGAYYGMFQDGESPFLDLSPLLELPNWIYAIEVLRDTGSALPLADALHAGAETNAGRDIASRLEARYSLLRAEKPDGLKPMDFSARDLLLFSDAHLAGLPLELGYRAHAILQRERNSEKSGGLKGLESLRSLKTQMGKLRLPLADELVGRFKEILEPFELKQPSQDSCWKAKVKLDRDELTRQARIIDYNLQRLNFSVALGLMHEWTVSWVVWWSEQSGHWVVYLGAREPAEEILKKFQRTRRSRKDTTEKERQLGEFWFRLRSLRNGTHHHGMGMEIRVDDKNVMKKLDFVLRYWKETLRDCPDFSRSPVQC